MSGTSTNTSLDELRRQGATVDLVTAGRYLGIGRSLAYELARRGDFPVRVLRLGNVVRVPTAGLLELLDAQSDKRPPAA